MVGTIVIATPKASVQGNWGFNSASKMCVLYNCEDLHSIPRIQ